MRTLRVAVLALAVLGLMRAPARAQGVGASLQVVPITPSRTTLANGLITYSVKFLCGTIPEDPTNPQLPAAGSPLTPGTYLTAVNIHNPNPKPVDFRKKAVVANPQGQQRGQIGQFVGETLKPDEALEVDCANIGQLLKPGSIFKPSDPFVKGFVVIITKQPLDVVGVYTYKNVVRSQIPGAG